MYFTYLMYFINIVTIPYTIESSGRYSKQVQLVDILIFNCMHDFSVCIYFSVGIYIYKERKK